MKKYKVIIDTDPGVDDTNALVYALNDPHFDIKLFSVCRGNISLNNSVRNMCHILDIFNKDIPVVKGYEKRLGSSTEDATFLHTKEGMGGYVPPKTTLHQPIDMDAADAMYEVLKKYPHQITVCVLGPHTNFAYLLLKHPDAKDLIKNVLMMGGAPHGIAANPNHNSFNIRTDTPAFKHTVDANLPTVMVPSSIGRDSGHFTEQQVEQIKNTNDVGRFLAKTFETYWEPNYPDRRIATNDISALYYLVYPSYYKTKRANIDVNLETGKTTPTYTRKGNFKIAVALKRDKFIKMLFKNLEKMNDIKIPQLTMQKQNAKAPDWKDEKVVSKTSTTAKKAAVSKSTKTKSTTNETWSAVSQHCPTLGTTFKYRTL